MKIFLYLIFIFLTFVTLTIHSCSKDKNGIPEIVNPKIDLIKNSKWRYKSINSFTREDTTIYYGGLSIIHNDTLIKRYVDRLTGKVFSREYKWTVDIFDSVIVFQKKHPEIVDSILVESYPYKLFWFSYQNILDINGQYFVSIDTNGYSQLPDSMYSNIIEFEIGGYKIGDFIDRDLVNIEDVSNWYSPPRENVHLKNDENLKLTIIGDSIIIGIEQKEISNTDIDDIIKVINEKTGIEPKYYHPDTSKYDEYDMIVESYGWGGYSDDYDIQLSRYQKIINESVNDLTKLMYSRVFGVGWGKWELTIESQILENMIKSIYFSNDESPKSKSQYIK